MDRLQINRLSGVGPRRLLIKKSLTTMLATFRLLRVRCLVTLLTILVLWPLLPL